MSTVTVADHVAHTTPPARRLRRETWLDGFTWGALFGVGVLLGAQALVWRLVIG